MVYVPPVAADLKLRFPEFAAVSDALIGLILAEAAPHVGDTWLERDRRPATLYLAAHMLAMEGEPGRTTTGVSVGTSGPIRREKVGDVEVEYAGHGVGGSGSSASGYASTIYGQRYLELLRVNFGGPIVV